MLLTVSTRVSAQVIDVTDAAFAQYLYDNYVDVCPTNGQIDISKTINITGTMNFNSLNISNIDEIIYFKNISGLIGWGNTITNFPAIADFPNLSSINLSGNKFTNTIDLTSLTSLTTINFNSCGLTEFPNIDGLTNLTNLDVGWNFIESIPDFTKFPNLTSVKLDGNQLLLSSFYYISTIPNFGTIFTIFPQEFDNQKKWHSVYIGDTIVLDSRETLPYDKISFRWLRDNTTIITDSTRRVLIVPNDIKSDADNGGNDIYEVAVRPLGVSEWIGKVIYSAETYIKVHECPTLLDATYTISSSCESGNILNFSAFIYSGTVLPGFTYSLIDENNQVITEIVINQDYSIPGGAYRVMYSNTTCSGISTFTINLPDHQTGIGTVDFTPLENCRETILTIDNINFNSPFSNPDFSLENATTSTITPILTNTTYNLEGGSYNLILNEGNYCKDTLKAFYEAPVLEPFTCPEVDKISYSVNFSCEQGYSINFSELSSKGCIINDFKYNLINERDEIVYQLITNNNYAVSPGNYRVQFTDEMECTTVFDSLIQVADFPKHSNFDIATDQNCKESFLAINSVTFEQTLNNPTYTLVHEPSQVHSTINLGNNYVVEEGIYNLIINEGLYCADTIQAIYDAPAQEEYVCPEINKIAYDVNFSCDNGYTIRFSHLSYKGCVVVPTDFQYILKELNGDYSKVLGIGLDFSVEPGDYIIEYTNYIDCTTAFDSIIHINDYPSTVDLGFNEKETCTTSTLTFESIIFSQSLLDPTYTLQNERTDIETEVELGMNYVLDYGIYNFIIDGGKYCSDTLYNIYNSPFKPEYTCPVIDSIAFDIAFDCNDGYSINFSHLSTSGCEMVDFYYQIENTVTNETKVVLKDQSTIIKPGNYQIKYTNNADCTTVYDTLIVIPNYLEITDVDFTVTETCKHNRIKINNITSNLTIDDPNISIRNISSGIETPIDLNEDFMLHDGFYQLKVNNGLYCQASFNDLYESHAIPECECINEIEIETEYSSNCKAAELSYTLINAPKDFSYEISAIDVFNNKTYLLSDDSSAILPHGIYNISISDNSSCSKIIENELSLAQPNNCDIVLYHSIPNAQTSYLLEGEGEVKLINERGVLIYTKNLPATINTYDLKGNRLPVGYYVLILEDGTTLNLSIVE